uniref:Putative glycosyltransferase At3g07620 n=1 Tax=Anthurium amnicola TaxID=1678845 RepID=A0A1D1ZCB8_9ARAE
MVSPACCNRETPRTPFYLVPAGLALLSSLIILLVYAPATSLLLHTQRLHPAAVGDHVDHLRNPAGSSVSPTPANHSVADATLGNSSGVPTPASSGKAPPFTAVFEGKRDEWEVKGQTPAGDQRKGNIIYREVFHDKEFFLEGYKEMNRSFKIFVYPHYKDDPFAHALLPVDFEPGGNYASESYFKKVLMQSHFITKDASEADLFFLPFSIARLRHDHRVDVGGIAGFVQMYIFNISRKYPYWNRTGGADHFYVACHSAGRSATDKAEEVKFNAIQVVCSASYFLSGYVAHKDVCLPQVWPRKGPPPKISSAKRPVGSSSR